MDLKIFRSINYYQKRVFLWIKMIWNPSTVVHLYSSSSHQIGKKLDLSMIEYSPEIQGWLDHFAKPQQATAISLLLHLDFITRDAYSEWLMSALSELPKDREYAFYAVRKFPGKNMKFWDDAGEMIGRPSSSLGSEDLVYSLIASVIRRNNSCHDHPGIKELHKCKIHHFVLIDDSIGSGKRVSDFISSMLSNKTLLSWWSYGFIKLHILAYARTREAERSIIKNIPGSDHPKRKYRKSSKVEFHSHIVYGQDWLQKRWGENYEEIMALCDSVKKIHKDRRKGFGGVMGNIVFYHSVPNNIPGILYSSRRRWKPLFPKRVFPDWLQQLLDGDKALGLRGKSQTCRASAASELTILLLQLIKRGVRSRSTLSIRMDRDLLFVDFLLKEARQAGLITDRFRLTKAGIDFLYRINRKHSAECHDYSLYIPSSWCTGRATVQPLTVENDASRRQADLTDVTSESGEAGEVSLEKTGAKAAPPPTGVMTQQPAASWVSHDTSGPKGLKER